MLIYVQTFPKSSFSFLVFGTRRECKQIHSQNKSSRGTIIKHREIGAEYITPADNYHCKRRQMRKMQNDAPGKQMLNPHPPARAGLHSSSLVGSGGFLLALHFNHPRAVGGVTRFPSQASQGPRLASGAEKRALADSPADTGNRNCFGGLGSICLSLPFSPSESQRHFQPPDGENVYPAPPALLQMAPISAPMA